MSTKQRHAFEPDYAVPPGETLREVMASLEMPQRELAQRTGLTEQSLHRIIRGEQPLTYETANRLELATGVPASLWNGLEVNYRGQLAKLDERKRLRQDLEWLKEIPTKELAERGEIAPQTDRVALVREVLAFYGVNDVDGWHKFWDTPELAAKRSTCFETRIGAASAWVRMGERQAHKLVCAPYGPGRFEDALREIRKLTVTAPDVYIPEMRRLCAESGVALALVREMKKVPWNGATKWLSAGKAMILLNLRGKGEDRFWFSFYHEAAHVLHDKKRGLLINSGEDKDETERRADAFAARWLVPESYDPRIRAATDDEAIQALAREIGVAPGIVAGRHGHLTGNWSRFKHLIRPLRWAQGD